MFAHGSGVQGSIPGWVVPKILKVVLDTSLLNTQQYKARIKGQEEHPLLQLSFVAIEKGRPWLLWPTLLTLTV